jgi:hypothetical protein
VDLVRNRHIRPQAIHLKMEKRTLEGKVLEDDGTVVDPIPAWVVLIHVGLGDGDGVGDVVQSDIVVFDVLGDTLSADPRLKVGGGQCAGVEAYSIDIALTLNLAPYKASIIVISSTHTRRAIRPCQMKASFIQ